MSTTDADLPALPHIPVVEKATVDVLGGKVIVELVAKDMVEALLHNYARAAIEADRARAQPAPSVDVPEGFELVPTEILDRFPEINPSNYDHDDACALNAWGVELVLAASPQPPTKEKA